MPITKLPDGTIGYTYSKPRSNRVTSSDLGLCIDGKVIVRRVKNWPNNFLVAPVLPTGELGRLEQSAIATTKLRRAKE